MFPVTITISNAMQLNAVMAAMNLANDATAVTAAQVKEYRDEHQTTMKDAKAAVQKEKAESQKAKADPKPDAAPTSEPTPTASDSSASSSNESSEANEPATYQDAAAAVTKLSRAKGREAAVAVLQQFEAAKLPDVKPEQFAAVIAACEKAMA